MVYERIQSFPAALFKRFAGVRPDTFATMVDLLRAHHAQTHRKPGRPPKLSREDQVLLTLGYWREYRTLFHMATTWGLHESTACRIVHHVEDVLVHSGRFRLPGKKALAWAGSEFEVIVVDTTETPIERPKKKTAALLQRPEEASHAQGATRGGPAKSPDSVPRPRARAETRLRAVPAQPLGGGPPHPTGG
jgi:hypothetical protein